MILSLLKESNMKKSYIFIILIFMLFKNQIIFAQFVVLSAPVFQGVYQRDNTNAANIPIAGQIVGNSTSSYRVECITTRLDMNGNVIPGSNVTSLITNATVKGVFQGTIIRNIGWYSISIRYTSNATNLSSSTTSKCGVGDVFIIAGQSNGQGVDRDPPHLVTTDFPEWIVGNNTNWRCRKEFENRPVSMSKISGANNANLIGPAGLNSWCYGVLGKRISDSNLGMPVAFFNTCSGGSSVKNWSDGANGVGTTGSRNGLTASGAARRWCAGFVSGQPEFISGTTPNPYYDGQPYTQLKNVLNWYVSLFGVRAILWHQGEADADADPSVDATNLSRTGTAYQTNLKNVIDKSRTDLGNPNLSWVVAEVSYNFYNTVGGTFTNNATFTPTNQAGDFALNVRKRQINALTNLADPGVVGGATVRGPLTDTYVVSNTTFSTGSYRPDNTHFSEGNTANGVGGLTFLANKWSSIIDPSTSSITSFNRIVSQPVPTVSIAQSGSNYTFSVSPAPGASYCWTSGNTLAPPLSGCLSTLSTYPNNSGSLRCYVKVGNNWQSTAQVSPQNCPGCRESSEEPDETYGGINMKLYPNPSDKDFRVEFDVPEDDTHVKLEFFDMLGNSVKVIADGSHAKGHFTYPITESLPTGASICQLKVGEIFISKKMIRVN